MLTQKIDHNNIIDSTYCSKVLYMDDIEIIIDRQAVNYHKKEQEIELLLDEHSLFINWPIPHSDPIDLKPSIIKSGLWGKLVKEINQYLMSDRDLIDHLIELEEA